VDGVQTEMIRGPSMRRDAWWLEPLPTIVLLGGFAIYATWAAFQNANYFADPYLSPFYSPCLAANCRSVTVRLFGSWFTASPALLILWIPGGFRATCYYYRKSYYRSFWGAPPACAARDMHKRYTGETRFPLIFQNLHRYFFWLVWPVLFFLWWDVVKAFDFPEGGIGMGMGTLVLLANAALLTTYSLSCHSCRHLAGGGLDVLSARPRRLRMWRFVTRLNERHGLIAWISLVGVGLADVYVRLVANGTIRDLRFF
jgi:hypothetical protein